MPFPWAKKNWTNILIDKKKMSSVSSSWVSGKSFEQRAYKINFQNRKSNSRPLLVLISSGLKGPIDTISLDLIHTTVEQYNQLIVSDW